LHRETPNAGRQARLKAGAQWTLEGVGSRPWFGWDAPTPQRRHPWGTPCDTYPATSQLLCQSLLEHLVRLKEERRGDGEAEGLGRLEVDDQLARGGLLDGEVRGLGALEDLVHLSR
jgi:hypothetical protein